jgi:ribosomal-protein-alanine acetyltransferase
MTIRLGLARRADISTIADMAACWIEAGLPHTWDERRIARSLADPESVVLVARSKRRIVGFAVIQFFDRHAHLNLLAVAPGYRRRGIGRALLEWLESSARTAGTFVLRLELRAGNEAAREFYRRHGFQDAGVSTDYYAGREDALRMVRDLAVAVT